MFGLFLVSAKGFIGIFGHEEKAWEITSCEWPFGEAECPNPKSSEELPGRNLQFLPRETAEIDRL